MAAVEQLEELQLLSATALLSVMQASPNRQVAAAVTNPTPVGNSPAQIAQAYGFNQIAFSNGAIKGNGAGQTIAIVDAYADPNIAADLQKFDAQFGLAAPPSFGQAIQRGATTNAGWGLETALDVEWAHAMAPAANILLVEANSSSLASLMAAVDYARSQPGVSVVSMSWGSSEFSSESAFDSHFTTPAGHAGVTFIAASGDVGAKTTWPSVAPNVLSVGGTTLTTSAGGVYGQETGWSGSGGGVSRFETEPTYQQSVQSSGRRSNPDVAFDADPNTGFAVYDSLTLQGQSGWFQVGGTSAGAPQWAALIAIANQGRTIAHLATLGNAQAAIYSLSSTNFHDVAAGSSGFVATAGYDLVTGRGSPIANLVVQSLVNGTTSSTQTTTAVATSAARTFGTTPTVRQATIQIESPVSSPNAPAIATLDATQSASQVLIARAATMQSMQLDVHAEPVLIAMTPAMRLDLTAVSVPPNVARTIDATISQGVMISMIQTGPLTVSDPVLRTSSATVASTGTAVTQPVLDEASDLDPIGAVEEDVLATATDAYFATREWSVELPAPEVTARGREMKTILGGIASTLGVFGLWRIRRRSDQSRKNAPQN